MFGSIYIHKSNPGKHNSWIQVAILLAGFSAVGSISLHVLRILSLCHCFFFLLLPAFVMILYFSITFPTTGRLVLAGWLYGIAAVALYDLTRIPFIYAGWLDFIPHIGNWLLNSPSANPLIGYLWRYLGNGGGMGISFVLLMQFFPSKSDYTISGILYGLFIFLCLMSTVLITPENGFVMFKITPLTFSGSLLGHLVYGWTLGVFLSKKIKTSVPTTPSLA